MSLPIGFVSAAVLLGAAWYVLINIIAEVYGMKISIYLFWSSAVCQVMFTLICCWLIILPSPSFWHEQQL